MSTRKKTIAVVPPLNVKAAEKVMTEYATADAKIQQIEAAMDEEIIKIRTASADRLQDLTDKKDLAFKKIQMYAETNTKLFEKKKSFEMLQGKIGFRTGTPKLKTLKGFTWAAVLNLLKTKKKTDFIKTVEQPKKDMLLANRLQPEVITLLPEIGLEVVQDETFFIELKKEETPNI